MTVMEMFVAFGMMMLAYFFMTQMNQINNQNNNQNNTGKANTVRDPEGDSERSSDKELLARKPKKKHANKQQPRRSRKVSEEEEEAAVPKKEPGEEQVPASSAGGEVPTARQDRADQAKGEDPAEKGDKADLEAAPQDDTERQHQGELQARADDAVRRVEEAVQSMQEVTQRMQQGETMLKTLQGRMDKVVQDMEGIGDRQETLMRQHDEMKANLKDMEAYMMEGEPGPDEHSDHGSDGATSQPDNVHDAPADHSTNDGASDGNGGNPDDGAADGDAGNQNDGTATTQDGGKGKGHPGNTNSIASRSAVIGGCSTHLCRSTKSWPRSQRTGAKAPLSRIRRSKEESCGNQSSIFSQRRVSGAPRSRTWRNASNR